MNNYSSEEKTAIEREIQGILDSINKYVEWTLSEVKSTEDFEQGWVSAVRDITNIFQEWAKRFCD